MMRFVFSLLLISPFIAPTTSAQFKIKESNKVFCSGLQKKTENSCSHQSENLKDVFELSQQASISPLSAEDGSLKIKDWYYGVLNKNDKEALEKVATAEGFSLKFINEYNSYIQDMAFFSDNGELLLNANLPINDDVMIGLTRGIYDNPDGPLRVLNMLTPINAQVIKRPFRKMQWTFLEGGGVISGKFVSGEAYAIITNDAVARTQAAWEENCGEELSKDKAQALIAQDLGLKANNLFSVPVNGHLDLIMMALPGGNILLNDPTQTIPVLNSLLKEKGLTEEEKTRISNIISFYQNGFQKRMNDGTPYGSVEYPFRDDQLKSLASVEKILKERFTVIRTPGAIKEVQIGGKGNTGYTGVIDPINMLDGFISTNAKGELFVVTNSTQGLPSLENYWRKQLGKFGVKAEHIHFSGTYSLGQGIDCLGASAP